MSSYNQNLNIKTYKYEPNFTLSVTYVVIWLPLCKGEKLTVEDMKIGNERRVKGI